MIKNLSCSCGQVRLELSKKPIISAECHCASCRSAGERLSALPDAPNFTEPNGGTRYVLYRKDRVRLVEGSELLRDFRLTPDAKTRRVVASCCNSPLFLEFSHGHWLSLYGGLWPPQSLPPLDLRTMVSDAPDGVELPDDVPNARHQTPSFFLKLLGAWTAMGFRTPKVPANAPLEA